MVEQKIYSQKLALMLIHNGCRLIRVEPNPEKPEFKVYIFETTPELLMGMSIYTELKHKGD